MAVTTIESDNELIRFTREFICGNLFSPYMGEGLTSLAFGCTPPVRCS
jgi:hypothetical protein